MRTEEHTHDTVLWQNLKLGDKHSFNQLFRKYYSQLFYYGIKIFPDNEFIEESIQEVFIRVWVTKGKLSDVKNVKAYLLISLRRMILSNKNKLKPEQHINIEDIENHSLHFEENEFEIHNELSDEIRQVLLKAVNSLTKKQKELILLFFYHDLGYKEIAEVMEIGVQATRNLMYRTLIHLRNSIGENSLNNMRNMYLLLFSSIPEKKLK